MFRGRNFAIYCYFLRSTHGRSHLFWQPPGGPAGRFAVHGQVHFDRLRAKCPQPGGEVIPRYPFIDLRLQPAFEVAGVDVDCAIAEEWLVPWVCLRDVWMRRALVEVTRDPFERGALRGG